MNEEEIKCLNDCGFANVTQLLLAYVSLQQENQQLKNQLEYLRSGEYLNQLKFERNMLEGIVQNMEVSKEDKEFIDMTHRNTELLEENQELKQIEQEHQKLNGELREENKELKSQLELYENGIIYDSRIDKLESVIDEIRKYIVTTSNKNKGFNCTGLLTENQVEKLLQILDKAKESE